MNKVEKQLGLVKEPTALTDLFMNNKTKIISYSFSISLGLSLFKKTHNSYVNINIQEEF